MFMYVYDLNKEIFGNIKLIISASLLALSFTSFAALDESSFSFLSLKMHCQYNTISGLIQWRFM